MLHFRTRLPLGPDAGHTTAALMILSESARRAELNVAFTVGYRFSVLWLQMVPFLYDAT